MTSPNSETIERRIRSIQQRIANLGPMRPGTLTVQYREPISKRHPFNQLSYTHRSKSRSDYIRPECLKTVREEVAVYRRFRKLAEEWVDLSIQASKLRMRQNGD